MRLRSRSEYLGLWERIHNADFKVVYCNYGEIDDALQNTITACNLKQEIMRMTLAGYKDFALKQGLGIIDRLLFLDSNIAGIIGKEIWKYK